MMHRRKSRRHQYAAQARWRKAERRAESEREAGIGDRAVREDARQPITLDLRTWGGPHLHIEPRVGYIAARALNAETGSLVRCCALKTMLREIADALPRMQRAGDDEPC